LGDNNNVYLKPLKPLNVYEHKRDEEEIFHPLGQDGDARVVIGVRGSEGFRGFKRSQDVEDVAIASKPLFGGETPS
jgi:hypothetical protein